MVFNNYQSNGVSSSLINWVVYPNYGVRRQNIEQTYLDTAFFSSITFDVVMTADGVLNVQACNGDPTVEAEWFTVEDGTLSTSSAQEFFDWSNYKYVRVGVDSGTLDRASISLGIV